MAGRYSAEFLLHLRQSPLCVKPPNLPPPEEWMGPPPETIRNQQKTANDRTKGGDSLLVNQDNRRGPHDRSGPRNAANPDELILGPPRTSFASATSIRNPRPGDVEKGFRDSERQDRADRFNFRNRANDSESGGDRFGRNARDDRNNGFRRRGDQDQDSEGWSTVKPRKSFGHEGTERFHGRMGGVGAGDRFGGRDDRRLRDRDDRESGDRQNRNRNFDHRLRDQDGDEPDTTRRNGLARGKSDSWFKENPTSNGNDAPMSQRERIDRVKSWRDRDPEDKPNDRQGDRNDRNYERRWDRDRQARVENDPEWLDEPAEEKAQGHTEEDFKKFMEEMKAAKGGTATKPEEKPTMTFNKPATSTAAEVEEKVVSAPAMDQGPDKFFATYGSTTIDASAASAEAKDAAKARVGKSSRFMAFLAPQDDSRAKTEPATPAAGMQPGDKATAPSQQRDAEKEAFALLLQKLQRSGIGSAPQSSGPPAQTAPNKFREPQFQELQQKSAVASPEPFQQYGNNDRRDDPRMRQHSIHDILSPRPVGLPGPPPPATRPEQALQDLLAQRHHIPNQTNARAAQNVAAVNRNTEFLMGLMQSHRDAPEPPRTEQLLLRMPQPTKQVSLASVPDREQDYPRERSASQRQPLRGQGGPPGFLDDNQFRHGDIETRPPPQPTQILQRPPPPPGLDHQMHPFLMGGANPAATAQMPPQRPMIPPPGLLNNGPRNVPMPGMFPPNFPPPHAHGHGGPGGPGSFAPGPPHPAHAGGPPPPDGLVGPPPPPGPQRSMQPPPGFFGGPPPPGFMPPPGMAGGGRFQGPDGPQPPNAGPGPFGGMPSPFDRLERIAAMERQGMMPQGGYRGP
ncbi:hypothetical protein C8A03DRAFT_36640 [Achaetomium macrosporum]|uniref:Uncharacterized protein n=1 Tax=Achaetomium macrosporum TaxID=79813 RepID=A0AAN7C4Z9_9PEZI|nr:hypothetical protein C8A03DRAFT_36640 [Achaetomium macrosporum]